MFFMWFVLVGTLYAKVIIEDESLKDNQRLIDARKEEEAAKLEIEASKKKLLEAQKIIEEELSQYLRFSTHIELGYITTSGNTDTQTASLDMTGKMDLREHGLKLDFDYIYGKDAAVESRNKLATELNYDYTFSKYFAFNSLVGYKDDKFSGYDYQVYTGPGIKYIAIKSDHHALNFQNNILYSVDKDTDKYYDNLDVEIQYPYIDPSRDQATRIVVGRKNEYASILLKTDYTFKITKLIKFTQEISYRADMKDYDTYFVKAKTGLLSKFNATFSMGINYKIDYVNTPPVGNVYTDNTFSVTLNIDY